ncbi:MAG: hypothetical protein ACI9G1_001574 [Pirellulaceae bacterium]|jgi:hypothetical protein
MQRNTVLTLPGFLLSLSRDDAKVLFSNRDPESIIATVNGFLESEEKRFTGCILDLEKNWNPIHRCLSDGSIDPNAGEQPLNHTILGGRHLYHQADRFVVLVRPDMVRHVAEALAKADVSQLEAKHKELPSDVLEESDDWPTVKTALQRIAALYKEAADDGNAVVFTAER